MDYSELVDALYKEDDKRVNRIIEEITPRLIRFLQFRMGATRSDAEDCVQLSLERALVVLREGRLKNPDRVLSYLMTSCRNNYLKMIEKKRAYNYDELPRSHFSDPDQLESLLDQERLKILKLCMRELKASYREFIEYWFEYPDSDAQSVADYFSISVNNVWTRKHRIIKKLHECYKRKSSK